MYLMVRKKLKVGGSESAFLCRTDCMLPRTVDADGYACGKRRKDTSVRTVIACLSKSYGDEHRPHDK